MHGTGLLVFLPAAAGEVSANDGLDGEDPQLADLHAPVAQTCGLIGWDGSGDIEGEEVGAERGAAGEGDEGGEEAEPVGGGESEDSAAVGDAVGEDDVVGGDAVGGDEEEGCRGEGEDVADFAGGELFEGGEVDGCDGHGGFGWCRDGRLEGDVAWRSSFTLSLCLCDRIWIEER